MYYDVVCQSCKYKEIDFEQSITKDFPAKCPKCKKKKLIKDWSSPEACPDFHVQEIKTVLQQAEKNQKDWGKELTEVKAEKLGYKKKKAEKPWYWDKNQTKPLDVSKIKNLKKYVEEGKKD